MLATFTSNFRTAANAAEGDAAGGRHRHRDGGGRRQPFTTTIHIPTSDGFMLHLVILFKVIMDGVLKAMQTGWNWIHDVIACFDFLLSPFMEEEVLLQLSIALILLDRSCASCLRMEQHLIRQAQVQQLQHTHGLQQDVYGQGQLGSPSLLESESSSSISSLLASLVGMLDEAIMVYHKEAAASTASKTIARTVSSATTNTFNVYDVDVGNDSNSNNAASFLLAIFGVLTLLFSYYCMSVSIASSSSTQSSHMPWIIPSSLWSSSSAPGTITSNQFHGTMYSGGVGGSIVAQNTIALYMLLTLFCIESLLFLSGSMLVGYVVFDGLVITYHSMIDTLLGREDTLSPSLLFTTPTTTIETLWNEVNDCPSVIILVIGLWVLSLAASRWVRRQLYQSIGD